VVFWRILDGGSRGYSSICRVTFGSASNANPGKVFVCCGWTGMGGRWVRGKVPRMPEEFSGSTGLDSSKNPVSL